MIYDLKPFEDLVDLGYLRKSETANLVLYGYTDQCTFDRHWNEHTRMARGLILNKNTGEVVAKPFPKFFNLGEMEETFLTALTNEPSTVQEKMDGSLGIIFNYEGLWQVATRGSFYSDQALEAAKIITEETYKLHKIEENITLLAEIIYPENKIIVNYGNERKLVLLSAYNRDTGVELTQAELRVISTRTGMQLAPFYSYSIDEMIELQKTLPKDKEGFVVRFDNGLRVKIKGEEYKKIAKIVSNLSPISFWEAMTAGIVNRDYLAQVPEEFRAEYEPDVEALEASYKQVHTEIEEDLKRLPKEDGQENYRKVIGLYLSSTNHFIKHKHAIFSKLDGKTTDVEKYIMKTIRPTGNAIKYA